MSKKITFTLLSFLAAVLLGGGTVSAEQADLTSSDSILQRVEYLESQVAYAEPACGVCNVSCGCSCGGGGGCTGFGGGGGGGGRVTVLTELLFLRFHEADGVSENQGDDTDRFDFDTCPRITLGYTSWDGLSARVRFFDYNHSAQIDGAGTYAVETYNVDLELAQELKVGRVTRLEFNGGFRYNHYEHREYGNTQPDEEFSGVGLTGGFEVKRDWSCGNFYGRARHAILVGDTRDAGEDFRGDSVLGQLELSVGYELVAQLSRGCQLSLRSGLELQQWFGYEDEEEDVGFSGFLLSTGINY